MPQALCVSISYINIDLECLHFRTSEAVPEDEDRIVGGHEVSPPHKYPFQVNKVNLIMERKCSIFQVYFASGHYACAGSGLFYLVRKLALQNIYFIYGTDTPANASGDFFV